MRPSRRKELMHAKHDFKRMTQPEIDKRVNFSDRMILIIGQGGAPKSLK
jgi:hypothetical protein